MLLLAAMLHPWMQCTQALSAVPSCLADDLRVFVMGEGCVALFRLALNETHAFVVAVGGPGCGCQVQELCLPAG
eukprot:7526790-Alexandrium_andersonii.AAC.1